MKRSIILFSMLMLAFSAMAQVKNPVKWQFSAKKINGTTYEVRLTANIDAGWHIYTMDHTSDIGVATSIDFNKNPLGTPEGKIKVEGKAVSMKDPSTGENVKFFSNQVSFVQVIKLKAAVKTNITGAVEFMSCDDKQCLPPTSRNFSIALQ